METYTKIAAARFNWTTDDQETKPLIGKEEYKIVSRTTSEIDGRLLELKKLFDRETARTTAFKLHNNNVDRDGNKRPASAYFTILGNRLIIEWGEIDAQGDAKLHQYLSRSVDYAQRVKKGGIVRSGHIGHVNLPKAGRIRIALLDSLWSQNPISPQDAEHNIVTTLLHNGILPITSDGYPISIPTTWDRIDKTTGR